MKKRTMAKIGMFVVLVALCVLLVNAVGVFSAAEMPANYEGPETLTTETITVDTTDTTETTETTVPTTEATEATQPSTEATVPATTEPEVTKTVETKKEEAKKEEKPATTEPTVPATTVPTVPAVTQPTVPVTEPTVSETESVKEPVEETKPVETTPVHVHNYTKTVVAATCATEGFTVNVCECGDSFHSDATEKAAHNYVKQVVSATTETEGYTLHVCEECGDSYKSDYTPVIVVVEEEVHNGCPCTEGHNHQEIKRGAYTVIYCEGIVEAYQDGYTIWMPWSKHQ